MCEKMAMSTISARFRRQSFYPYFFPEKTIPTYLCREGLPLCTTRNWMFAAASFMCPSPRTSKEFQGLASLLTLGRSCTDVTSFTLSGFCKHIANWLVGKAIENGTNFHAQAQNKQFILVRVLHWWGSGVTPRQTLNRIDTDRADGFLESACPAAGLPKVSSLCPK